MGNEALSLGNNPVKYVDPDGRQTIFISRDEYNTWFESQIYAVGHLIKAGIQDAKGKIRNYFSNAKSRKMHVSPEFSATLNINGTPIKGTISFNPEDGFTRSSSLSTPEDFASALMELTGSPVQITTDSVSLVVGVVGLEVTDHGDTATASIKLTAEKIPTDAIDNSAQLNFTASTQDGSFGTIENGKNEDLNNSVREANRLGSFDFILEQ